MNHSGAVITLRVLLIILTLSLIFNCNSAKRSGEEHPVISSAPLPEGKPLEPVQELPKEELYYGEGDCAPKFANGMRGTCINNQPCNGFGVKDEKGNLKCECFGTKGGCPEEYVCSVIKRACVTPREAER